MHILGQAGRQAASHFYILAIGAGFFFSQKESRVRWRDGFLFKKVENKLFVRACSQSVCFDAALIH
jgi:hypothetical protein